LFAGVGWVVLLMVVGALRDLRRPAVDGRARQVECRFYVDGAMRMMSAAAVGRAPFHAPFGHLRAASLRKSRFLIICLRRGAKIHWQIYQFM